MTLHFHTAHASYYGPDRVDITRAGCDGLLREGRDAPGSIFAPSADLVYPVITKIFPGAMALLRAKEPVGQRLLGEVWAAYKLWYAAEMRVSYGALERRNYGPLEQLAEKRGVRPAHDRWARWLEQEQATFVCACTFRIGDELMCHRAELARIMVALGAVYEGEVGKEAGR